MSVSRKPFEERGVPGPVHGLVVGSLITFVRAGALNLNVFSGLPFDEPALTQLPDEFVQATVVQVRIGTSFLAHPADRKNTFKHSSLQSFRYDSEGSHWIRGHHAEDALEMRAWAAARALMRERRHG